MGQETLPSWAVMEPPEGASWFVRLSFYLHKPHTMISIYAWVAGALGFWTLFAQGYWDWFLFGLPHTLLVATMIGLHLTTRYAYRKHGGITGLRFNPRAKPIKRNP